MLLKVPTYPVNKKILRKKKVVRGRRDIEREIKKERERERERKIDR